MQSTDTNGHQGIPETEMRESLRLTFADEGAMTNTSGVVGMPTRAENGDGGSWAETSKLRVTGAAHGDRLLRARSRVWRDSHLGVVGRE